MSVKEPTIDCFVKSGNTSIILLECVSKIVLYSWPVWWT